MMTGSAASDMKTALTLHQKGKLQDAAAIYKTILTSHPDHPDALHLLGLTYFQSEYPEEAKKWITKAIELEPANPKYHSNLATVLITLNEFEAALKAVEKAIAISPHTADYLVTTGVIHQRMQRFNEAERAYLKALATDPQHANALFNLATLKKEQNEYEAAGRRFFMAIEYGYTGAAAYAGLGQALLEQHKLIEARAAFEKAIEKNNQLTPAVLGLARIDILENKPEYSEKRLRHFLTEHPSDPDTLNNLGYALRDLDRLDEAIEAFEACLRAAPGHADAHTNLGLTLLTKGSFAKGWQEYRWRHESEDTPIPLLEHAHAWAGQEITGTDVVACMEQGLGDQILQSTLIPDIAALTASLQVICAPRLLGILQRSFPGTEFYTREDYISRAQSKNRIAAPLLDLASLVRTSAVNFPRQNILSPERQRTEAIRQRYLDTAPSAGSKPILVGISWQSGHRLHGVHNTISLENWEPLAAKCAAASLNVCFISAQFGNIAEDVKRFNARSPLPLVLDPNVDHAADFEEIACQVAALDIVISTSTTTLQLAGALGIPAIHLTSSGLARGWYWGFRDETCLWYPSVRQIHRSRFGSREEQISQAAETLIDMIKNA